ncbi:hypothetical protein AXF42_Ash003705 [Apostasia shenzhenica]|uniref:Uncharacterized protein n=1 Tax=Apostasia shenzhenica TaxID=1088818 RepID=A0A2I0AHQ7_9ASPA|nr:hypothetical protein AXF42_Ash003705 [Apostasia shenzhenica]
MVSLLMKAQGGNQFRAFRETHRGLRWFREKIPYVHRSINEGISLIGRSGLAGLYNAFFEKEEEEGESSSVGASLYNESGEIPS